MLAKKAYRLLLSTLLIAVISVVGFQHLDAHAFIISETEIISLANADMTLVGEDVGDWAGYFVSPAGDVNNDKLGDFLVGAPMAGNKVCPQPIDPCPGLPKGEGKAYLILGEPQSSWLPNPINLINADVTFLGCETFSMTARQLYTAGDVNGDGYDDFLISGWKCGIERSGKVYLFLGRSNPIVWGKDFSVENADAIFISENTLDRLGYYNSTAGDINGDGFDDFLITSTKNDDIADNGGKAYLVLGREIADWGQNFNIGLAEASFLGEFPEDRLGRSATGIGDVNGDGYDDFLISSISNDEGGIDAGQSYLFLGRGTDSGNWWGTDYSVAGADASFIGEVAGDESGRRVAGAGDVNGDGLYDFLIGAALNDQTDLDAGKAYLILGRALADWGMDYSLTNADASFRGEVRRDQAGRRVSGAGDVNHDGFADFLVGAPHNSQGGLGAGAVYLIYGRQSADWGANYPLSMANFIYVGKSEGDVAGYDVAWTGDFNGDNIDDFLIGAYGQRQETDKPGETYLILGKGPSIYLPLILQ